MKDFSMAYKGILFDFDGVAVDSMHQHYDAWSKAFAEKNVVFEKEDFFQLEGQGLPKIARMLGEQHGLAEREILDIVVNKVRYYYSLHKTQFYDYFLTMIQNLKNKKIPMAVVTGGQRERVFAILEEYFSGVFKNAVTIDDVKNGKPHPEPFLKGAEMLDLDPKECIVIENAPLGITSAKKAGCLVLAVKTTLTEKYLGEADFIYNTFQEVEEKLFSLL
jgi:beta-phosphoglucomutase